MSLLDAAALLLALAAALGLFNHHVLKLPFAIGLLISSLLASIGVLAIDKMIPSLSLAERARGIVLQIDFAETVLSGMLTLLLFAGALHTDLSRMKERIAAITALASVGVVISTLVAGGVAHVLFGFFGIHVDLIWCLAFGALISPTDPIAVLGVMKSANAPKQLEMKVIGESLLNDGTGVILFTVFTSVGLATAHGGPDAAAHAMSLGRLVTLLIKEIIGGITLGLVAGYVCYRAFKTLDEPNLEILMTVATVFVIGSLAIDLHLSGPLAAVAAGLFIGNRGRIKAMSETTAQNLDVIWTFIDEMLNAVLFLLIGLELLAIDISRYFIFVGLALVPAVLFARLVSVAGPVLALRMGREIDPWTIRILTWGGLKGGVSVALAMKLPEFDGRAAVLTVTYVIVIFSIVVQGLTVGRLLRWAYPGTASTTDV
ncbi:MAG TPA: sodium:proton antiporter [Polyangiaceae bacterium]|nr:sodium:proton antiporter [Polyangiaceae bacterium]